MMSTAMLSAAFSGVSANTGELSNGMRYLAVSQPDAFAVTAVLCVRSGFLHEGAALTGIAHLMEHLTYDLIGAHYGMPYATLAANLGASYAAKTSLDCTYFSFQTPAENVVPTLALERGRFVSPPDIGSIDHARAEVKCEILSRIGSRLTQAEFDMVSQIAPDVPRTLGIYGDEEWESRISAGALIHWHEVYYTPANVSIVIYGGMGIEELCSALEMTVGRLPELRSANVIGASSGVEFRDPLEQPEASAELGPSMLTIPLPDPQRAEQLFLQSYVALRIACRCRQHPLEGRDLHTTGPILRVGLTDGGPLLVSIQMAYVQFSFNGVGAATRSLSEALQEKLVEMSSSLDEAQIESEVLHIYREYLSAFDNRVVMAKALSRIRMDVHSPIDWIEDRIRVLCELDVDRVKDGAAWLMERCR